MGASCALGRVGVGVGALGCALGREWGLGVGWVSGMRLERSERALASVAVSGEGGERKGGGRWLLGDFRAGSVKVG